MPKKFSSQSGIAIGPILFIVALLAILAAAIAAGSGSFTAGTSQESATTQAATIIQNASLMKDAVQRVCIENGCAATQISFSNPLITQLHGGTDPYANSNAPADKSCNVFSPSGGAIQFPTITASTDESAYDGGYFLIQGNNSLANSGPTSIPLVAVLPIDSSLVCQAINKDLGLSGYTGVGAYTVSTDPNGHYKNGYFANHMNLVQSGFPSPPPLMGCVRIPTKAATYSNLIAATIPI